MPVAAFCSSRTIKVGLSLTSASKQLPFGNMASSSASEKFPTMTEGVSGPLRFVREGELWRFHQRVAVSKSTSEPALPSQIRRLRR